MIYLARWLVPLLPLLAAATALEAGVRPCPPTFRVADAPAGATRIFRTACGGSCAFDVTACVNENAAACTASPLDAILGRTVPAGTPFALPADASGPASCGQTTRITLRPVGRRPARLRLRTDVRTSAGRRRHARVTLVCLPGPDDGCAGGEDEGMPPEQVPFPGCEAVTAERQYCLTTTAANDLAVVGLDSGQVCRIVETDALAGAFLTHSLAWRGEVAYACVEDGLRRISLRDGTWQSAGTGCEAVAGDASRLLVMPFLAAPSGDIFGVQEYRSFDAVRSGAVADTYSFPFVTRLTLAGEMLYGAWHSTGSVERLDLATGSALPAILLDGYDDWIFGMSVMRDGELAVSGSLWGDTIYRFDANTGQALGQVRPSEPVTGLACVSRDPPAPATTTTTTTLPPPSSTGAWACCESSEVIQMFVGGCAVEADESTVQENLFRDSCVATGGSYTVGRCTEPCGPVAGCCVSDNLACGVFDVLGDGSQLATACARCGGMLLPGACP